MGASTDVMHDFVTQEIRRLYSTYDGWNITSRNQGTKNDEVITLQRFNTSYREFAKVGVTFAKEVDPDLIAIITTSERSSDGTCSRFSSSIILPEHADASSVPKIVTVQRMRSFTYDGDSLIWLKKPVCESAGAAAPSAK